MRAREHAPVSQPLCISAGAKGMGDCWGDCWDIGGVRWGKRLLFYIETEANQIFLESNIKG